MHIYIITALFVPVAGIKKEELRSSHPAVQKKKKNYLVYVQKVLISAPKTKIQKI